MPLENYESLNSHVICAAGVHLAAMFGTHIPLEIACRARYACRMAPRIVLSRLLGLGLTEVTYVQDRVGQPRNQT